MAEEIARLLNSCERDRRNALDLLHDYFDSNDDDQATDTDFESDEAEDCDIPENSDSEEEFETPSAEDHAIMERIATLAPGKENTQLEDVDFKKAE